MITEDQPLPRDATAILRARALELAQPETGADTGELLDLLEFRIGRDSYAIEARHVGELVALGELTPVPCTPPFMLGVVNIRGRIVLVVDIKKFLGQPDRGLTDLHHIILVRGKGFEIGVLADVIVGVRRFPQETLQPPSAVLAGTYADYFKGVTAERLVVLDMDRILNDPAMVLNEEVET